LRALLSDCNCGPFATHYAHSNAAPSAILLPCAYDTSWIYLDLVRVSLNPAYDNVLLAPLCTALQAGVNAAAMRGVLEKSDLLRVAKAHMQLWECRRLILCGELAKDPAMRLYSAVCVFRITAGPGQDMFSAVRAVKDGLKRTRQRLALLVHPDKALNELSGYKEVFDEAFKVLTAAHETLTDAAEGKADAASSRPQPQAQQQQQQQGYGYTNFAGGFPGAWGFAGGFPGAGAYYWSTG